MIPDRTAFRMTADDYKNVATIAAHIQPGATFVSRSDVMRTALRVAAKVMSAEAEARGVQGGH